MQAKIHQSNKLGVAPTREPNANYGLRLQLVYRVNPFLARWNNLLSVIIYKYINYLLPEPRYRERHPTEN